MSITQLNIIFAVGEIGLLILVVALALVARWAGQRETAREIAALPVYQPKPHGMEGPVTLAAAQSAAVRDESANFRPPPQPFEADSKKEQVVKISA